MTRKSIINSKIFCSNLKIETCVVCYYKIDFSLTPPTSRLGNETTSHRRSFFRLVNPMPQFHVVVISDVDFQQCCRMKRCFFLWLWIISTVVTIYYSKIDFAISVPLSRIPIPTNYSFFWLVHSLSDAIPLFHVEVISDVGPAALNEEIFFFAESAIGSAELFFHSFHCPSTYSCNSHLVVTRERCDNSRWMRRKPEPETNDPTSADGMWSPIIRYWIWISRPLLVLILLRPKWLFLFCFGAVDLFSTADITKMSTRSSKRRSS